MTSPEPRAEYLARSRQAADLLSSIADVDAVMLFGSVARGDATPSSDTDLLVVADTQLDPSVLRRALSHSCADSVNFVCRSHRGFRALMTRGDSFAAHLHSEGIVLLDRSNCVTRALREPFAPGPVEEELSAHLRRVGPLEDLRQFGDFFVFCYARLYAIGKSVVMARLHERGQSDFDRRRAFMKLSAERPDLSSDISLLVGLSPYYDAVSRGNECELPAPYEGADARRRAADAIDAIKRIARAA